MFTQTSPCRGAPCPLLLSFQFQMHIVLLRFQGVPKELPQRLEAPLREAFSLPVSTAPGTLRLPPAAYYVDREQWRAAALLSAVEETPTHGEPPGSVRLGIAAHDLFATGEPDRGTANVSELCSRLFTALACRPTGAVESFAVALPPAAAAGLNFVFGEASRTAHCAVFSIVRYAALECAALPDHPAVCCPPCTPAPSGTCLQPTWNHLARASALPPDWTMHSTACRRPRPTSFWSAAAQRQYTSWAT